MLIEELMSKEVFTCRPDDSLCDAARTLADHDCGCVPVVDRDHGVVGILTDRDICLAACEHDAPLSSVRVSEVMTRDVRTCNAMDPVSAAVSIMRTHRVRRVPVVDVSNQVVGLLALNDLARESVRGGPSAKGEVTRSEVAETLAEICAPKTPALLES